MIEEAVAGIGGYSNEKPVRDDFRAGGDGGEYIRSRFFQNWCGFARDGGFIDVSDSFDDRAVRGEEIVLFNANDVAYA